MAILNKLLTIMRLRNYKKKTWGIVIIKTENNLPTNIKNWLKYCVSGEDFYFGIKTIKDSKEEDAKIILIYTKYSQIKFHTKNKFLKYIICIKEQNRNKN